MRLARRFLIMVVLLEAVILLNSAFLYYHARRIVHDGVDRQLESVTILKERDLKSYFDSRLRNLRDIAAKGTISDVYCKNEEASEHDSEIHHMVRAALQGELQESGILSEIFVMDEHGVVHLSTNEHEEGKVRSDEPYFTNGRSRPYVQAYYFDTSLGRVSATVAIPLYCGDGRGHVLAAKVNLAEVGDIMNEQRGLGQTGETILVNRFNYLVSGSRYLDLAAMTKVISTDAVDRCFSEGQGFLTYKDYRGKKVYGRYLHIPERNVCLIAKLDTQEADELLTRLLRMLAGVTAASLVIAFAVTGIIVRSVQEPLQELQEAATKIGLGNLNATFKKKGKDEFGELATVVENMAKNLRTFQEKLVVSEKKHARELEKKVADKESELVGIIDELERTKTAVMNMMEDLEQANKDLRELDRAKANFLNIVSHELKTPLTAMIAHLEILADMKDNLSPQQLSSFDAIHRNCGQLKILIDNILEISRIESGKFQLNLGMVDLAKTASDSVENLRPVAEKHGLELRTEFGELPQIWADEVRIREIINNLLTNAIKFTEKGYILVKTEAQGDFVKVTVEDTGIGIPKEKMSSMFTKFFQVDASISRRYGGTGLGLSIVKQLVELQGGRVWVESEAGMGSKFMFTLPVKAEEKNG